MTLDEFTPLVGHDFEVDCSPATVRLALIEASPGRWPVSGARPPFKLLFQSPAEILLVSGTYTMQCRTFGPDLIHINPVSLLVSAEPGHYYEAVFN